MAELASGAVSSLLGLLRNEALLLSRVGSDVEFIKEEMESMHSFLEHLSRTTPPTGGGHDEQVGTWMKQVQDLAHDCSNCVDLFIRLGDPAVFRARAGRWRYLWWASWLVQRMVAQHKAAIRLRELKERARDVGQRRLRYGVELPGRETTAKEALSSVTADDEEGEEEEDIDQNQVLPLSTVDGSDDHPLEPRVLEEYFAEKLARWLKDKATQSSSIASTAIVAPDDVGDAGAIARELLMNDNMTTGFESKVICLAEVHHSWDLPLQAPEILCYIMRQCEPKPQNEAYRYKEQICWEIWDKVSDEIDVWDKIDKIKTSIGRVDSNKLEETKRLKSVIDKQRSGLVVLLIALRLLQNEHTHTTTLSRDKIIEEAASRLRAHMGMGPEAGKPKPSICLELSQFKDILKKAFPESKTLQSQAQEAASTVTAATSLGLGEDYIKEIINNHRITLDIILSLLPKPPIILQGPFDSDANKVQTTAGAVASVIEQGKEIPAKEATPPDSDANKEQTTAGAAASVIEQGKEISAKEATPSDSDANKEQTTADAVASVAKEATDETKEKLMELSAAVIKETKQKLKDISGQVTSDVVAYVVTEARKKLKEISGDVVADVVTEARKKLKEISGQVESTEARKKLKEISGEVESTIKEETMEKMSQIRRVIQEQLLTKGVVDMLKPHLEAKKTLIVLQDDKDYISQWEETRNALSLLNCAPGSAVIVCTKKSEKAKEFCNQDEEPITCSLVGFYHDKMLLNLKQRQVENSQILRDILDRCHPHDFCMRIFADALSANPKRSQGDLQKLQEDLVHQGTLGSKAKKMLKFSYKDLPREYKTCLLYLAIFPQGYKIRRSTLIGRWVTEGLITKQDWCTTVRHAEQCFDALIRRGLVLPCDIDAAGKVKRCMVGDQVHGFITKIANKQHILDARLSDLWARHFSIFSGIRLRTSDRIDNFVRGLPKYSPQLPLLKVLDLEGTTCFDKNYYLKDICKKILLLKYLSLRRTNVSHLPSEINNLHELEVLDIRETKVHEDATRHVLLLKLRRFLADRVDQRMNGKPAVRIPLKIEKMENLEVLTNVKASRAGKELKDIRNLWQLRKLGVVIDDREDHLSNLFQAIIDLKESLLSLSITICNSRTKSIPSSKEQQQKGLSPKYLENLTINGNGVSSRGVQLLELAKGSDGLAKVTLSGTLLEEKSLQELAMLPKLRCVRLRSNAYSGSKLTFRKEDFQHLKYFLVEGTIMKNKKETQTETDITFENGATAELEKIVMSFTNIGSLDGVDSLRKLKELELENNQFLHSFSHTGTAHEENTRNRGLDQSTDNTSKVPMQNIESTAPERTNENRDAEQNTQGNSTDEQNTNSTVSEENNQSRAPEQNPEIKAPKQSTQTKSSFTFRKNKFQHLVYFRFKDSKMTNIIFEPGGAPELKKIALSLNDTRSNLIGINHLLKLKEIVLKGEKFLLSFFNKADQIAKIILRDTQLKQADIQNLAKKQNLRCLVLLDKSYNESQLTLNKDDFTKLDLLIVECHNIKTISFTQESAPNLKKIIWSFTNMESLSGIDKLLKLKEIECRGEFVPYYVRRDIAAHQNQLVFTHKKPLEQGQAEETNTLQDNDDDT